MVNDLGRFFLCCPTSDVFGFTTIVGPMLMFLEMLRVVGPLLVVVVVVGMRLVGISPPPVSACRCRRRTRSRRRVHTDVNPVLGGGLGGDFFFFFGGEGGCTHGGIWYTKGGGRVGVRVPIVGGILQIAI